MRFIESTKGRVTVWVIQGLLALLFLFAGGMKLATPTDALVAQSHMPGLFMKFIGVCEVAGAVGLILPELLRIARVLTPVAAAGLVLLMIGATWISVTRMGAAAAILPFVTGLLAAFVAYELWPRSSASFTEPHATG